MVKICIRCKSERPIQDFMKSAKSRDGYSSYCKGCRMEKINQNFVRFNTDNNWKEIKKKLSEKNKNSRKDENKFSSKIKCELLKDDYIKNILLANGFSKEQIQLNPELINIKREVIKIKRYVKEKTRKKHSGAKV